MTAPIRVREENERDHEAIRALLISAFGGTAEADLVEDLRRDSDLAVSLVAYDEEGVHGYAAFSPLAIDGAALRAAALGPLAVAPERQRQGIGKFLAGHGLLRLREAGFDLVLVLGDPAYYGELGFEADAARAFKTPYDGPYQQALALTGAGALASGTVHYAPAFAKLG